MRESIPGGGERGASPEQTPACCARARTARVAGVGAPRVSRLPSSSSWHFQASSASVPSLTPGRHLPGASGSRSSPAPRSPLPDPCSRAPSTRAHRHGQRSVQGPQRSSASHPGALLSPSSFRVFRRVLGKPPFQILSSFIPMKMPSSRVPLTLTTLLGLSLRLHR